MKQKPAFEGIVRRDAERGQAIVLIAIFLVAMIAMLGVAIDGGGLFLLWRDAQNAADSAVLQAAYARCTGPIASNNWIQTGTDAANDNGFITSSNASADTAVTVYVREWPDDTSYVQVLIEAQKPSYFIKLVYPGALEVRAEAIATCERAYDASQNPGAVAYAGPNVCPHAEFDWSGADAIIDGDVHTNGDFQANGNNADGREAEVTGGVSIVGDDLSDPSKMDYTEGPPDTDARSLPFTPLVDLNYYNPTTDGRVYNGLRAVIDTNTGQTAGQANYVNGDWNMDVVGYGFVDEFGNPQTELEGLYFVTGDTADSGPVIGPEGITIVSLTGQIKISGFEGDYYSKLLEVPATDGIKYPGLIMATEYDVRGAGCPNGASGSGLFLNGSNVTIYGVLYAPYSEIELNFSSVFFRGAMFGYTIEGSGSDLHYIFEGTLLPIRPPTVGQVQ